MNEFMAGDLTYKPKKLPPFGWLLIGLLIGLIVPKYLMIKHDAYMADYANKIEMNTLQNIKLMCDRGVNPKMKGKIPQLLFGNEFYWCYKASSKQ